MNGLGVLFLFDNFQKPNEKYFGYFLNSNQFALGIRQSFLGYNYCGEFLEGSETGYAEIIDQRKPTYKYEGLCLNNLFEGFGEMTGENFFYAGGFYNGKRSGIGYYISDIEGIEYIGGFDDNLFSGLGYLRWLETPLNKGKCFTNSKKMQNKNENSHKEGSKKGSLDLTSPSIKETVYYGEFQSNKMNGFGKLLFNNGDEYTGHFEKGIYNGYGEFINSQGKTLKGNWVDGKKQDWFEYKNNNDETFYVKFKKDVQVATSKICPYNL